MRNELINLVGKRVKKVFIDDDCLVFETDKGNIGYVVEGDCCSRSYFHDFIGVKNLFGKEVKAVEEIEVDKSHTKKEAEEKEETQWYGYRIITEDAIFGEMSSVFSFRNESNGYYGGMITELDPEPKIGALKELKEDWLND